MLSSEQISLLKLTKKYTKLSCIAFVSTLMSSLIMFLSSLISFYFTITTSDQYALNMAIVSIGQMDLVINTVCIYLQFAFVDETSIFSPNIVPRSSLSRNKNDQQT